MNSKYVGFSLCVPEPSLIRMPLARKLRSAVSNWWWCVSTPTPCRRARARCARGSPWPPRCGGRRRCRPRAGALHADGMRLRLLAAAGGGRLPLRRFVAASAPRAGRRVSHARWRAAQIAGARGIVSLDSSAGKLLRADADEAEPAVPGILAVIEERQE